jgi:hypothetical protein
MIPLKQRKEWVERWVEIVREKIDAKSVNINYGRGNGKMSIDFFFGNHGDFINAWTIGASSVTHMHQTLMASSTAITVANNINKNERVSMASFAG